MLQYKKEAEIELKFRLVKTMVFEIEADDKFTADRIFRQMESEPRFAKNIFRDILVKESSDE